MLLNEFLNKIVPVKDKLFRFALRLVNDREEAEDIVQDVLMKVWDKKDSLDQVQNPEAWCMTLTRNLSIDRLRAKRQHHVEIETQLHIASSSASPHRQAEVSDLFSKMKVMMEQLPEKQKLSLHLREVEGMSYDLIAETLGITLDQVKTNIFRARQSLRSQLIQVETYGL